MPPRHTRGQRHLRQFLESSGGLGAETAASGKTARDVVPVLQERQGGKEATGKTKKEKDSHMAPNAVAYLQSSAANGAANKMSQSQAKLIEALSSVADARAASPFKVKRAVMKDLKQLADTIALAAVQRRVLTASDVALTASSLFVLTDNASAARQLQQELTARYGMDVLLLSDNAKRHPTFPLKPVKRARSRSPPPAARKQAKKKKGEKAAVQVSADETEEASNNSSNDNSDDRVAEEKETGEEKLSCAVVIATPKGFLAVDKRSAIWKFIGAYVIALVVADAKRSKISAPSSLTAALTATAADSETARGGDGAQSPPLALRMAEHRWDCLGHTTAAAVLSLHEKTLTAPILDWCLTLRPTEKTSALAAADAAVAVVDQPQHRRPVTVHYAVAEGLHRFGFLFSLVKNLSARRGLVVHLATKEACAFLYNVLYSFLNELPSHVQLLTDYEGEGEFSASVSSMADRYALCQEFNGIVTGKKAGTHTAAVLLSCYGLVPTKGDIYVAYDIIPDVVNFNHFVADVLTPGAYGPIGDTSNNNNNKKDSDEDADAHGLSPQGLAQRDRTVRKRGRSVSPPPRTKTGSAAGKLADEEEKDRPATPALYKHIILLFRPNERKGALRHLTQHQARYQITYTPLPLKPSLSSYLLHGEALREMHKTVFTIANTAYFAYKATMAAYCTVGPRDVYSEKEVNLEKVSEEFGHTELPLLDLRLKDTVFRPKEDLYKAAKVKQLAERRAYKKFVDANIVGEGPEEHLTAP